MYEVAQIIGWVGLLATGFATIVAGIRALIRGPKEVKAIEVEVQDRITAMAERWLTRADERLASAEQSAENANQRAQAAEERAERAENEVANVMPRLIEVERNLFSALDVIGVLWPWGLNGGGDPKPVLPAWIFEWLHKQSKGT